ncbi:uncharacterized protein Z519_09279 [Cladophialophora bantiana CBS 173.52]|uniref:Uncharacterized protein n=1 Tax=Cladophialophora bantiana (strain ATCC 10958 / CBS 173.52 / CDC B-1940 / NIH 8579) TaxID=1442370 RepID=A0A0D2HGB8_CLAB1|nr:uncharacterized protein Z519_09279 [Cladophialophora bantiana CBS 173.52]KIW89850.1 hypothetical protein Z519_09279 [Cladophialophora bantiana CBS 173.52]
MSLDLTVSPCLASRHVTGTSPKSTGELQMSDVGFQMCDVQSKDQSGETGKQVDVNLEVDDKAEGGKEVVVR